MTGIDGSSDCPRGRSEFGLRMLLLRWRNVVDGELRGFGVTSATWRALFHVGEMGDGVRPKHLAEVLEMERPSLSQLLDRLEASGLVTRREDPEDHRGKTVHLTDEGREVHRRTVMASSRVARRLMAEIGDDELAVVESVFARISAAISAVETAGATAPGATAPGAKAPGAKTR